VKRKAPPRSEFKPSKSTHPTLTKAQENKKPISGLDAARMQRLVHNLVLWCDHENGTVLDKDGNPFSAFLEMENVVSPETQKKWARIMKGFNTIVPFEKQKKLSAKEMEERFARIGYHHVDLHTKKKMHGYFRYQTSPHSNGNLNFSFWFEGELVFMGYDIPGPVYQYPSKDVSITVYNKGPWEKFLLDKKYDGTKGTKR
jgi:hypothetical protein